MSKRTRTISVRVDIPDSGHADPVPAHVVAEYVADALAGWGHKAKLSGPMRQGLLVHRVGLEGSHTHILQRSKEGSRNEKS